MAADLHRMGSLSRLLANRLSANELASSSRSWEIRTQLLAQFGLPRVLRDQPAKALHVALQIHLRPRSFKQANASVGPSHRSGHIAAANLELKQAPDF